MFFYYGNSLMDLVFVRWLVGILRSSVICSFFLLLEVLVRFLWIRIWIGGFIYSFYFCIKVYWLCIRIVEERSCLIFIGKIIFFICLLCRYFIMYVFYWVLIWDKRFLYFVLVLEVYLYNFFLDIFICICLVLFFLGFRWIR